MQMLAMDPGLFAAAFAGDEIVAIVVPDLKVAVVRPEHRRRGIGRRMIDLALAMEAERGRPELFMGSIPDAPGGEAFLRATGFTFHSTVWDLELPPDRPVPPPIFPDGIVARPFDRSRDVTTLASLVNAAFAAHPTPVVMEEEMVRASLDDENVLDDDAILLEDSATGETVGFCLADLHRVDGRIVSTGGEIGMVGVRPDRQGRGLGRQLLRAGVAYLREAGLSNVGLAVNGRNAGALGLYESEGFVRARTRDRWSRPVPAS
jgi:mycothiol synthase